MMNRESLSFTGTAKQLPDIANEASAQESFSSIDWVGMSDIEVPVILRDAQGVVSKTAAKASCFVSLDNENSRGIHMSRLFKQTQSELAVQDLNFSLLKSIVDSFLLSHQGIATQAKIEVKFDALVLRKALVSQNQGWRSYPVKLQAHKQLDKPVKYYLELVVTYSSTCPASAALARQLIQENFKDKFISKDLDFKQIYEFLGSTSGIVATPHAQRSEARIKLELNTENTPIDKSKAQDFVHYIDLIEEVLGTPVQTLVKREDEQEFAFRNGQNLMFCEDAARKIKAVLSKQIEVNDFIAQVSHFESLHPHNAVSTISMNKELRGFE